MPQGVWDEIRTPDAEVLARFLGDVAGLWFCARSQLAALDDDLDVGSALDSRSRCHFISLILFYGINTAVAKPA
jgi:hypothetical protein